MAIQTLEMFGPAIPEGYVDMPEAMRILGKSQPTLERHVTQRTFPMQFVERRNQRPMRVFERKALEDYNAMEQRRKDLRPPSGVLPRGPSFGSFGSFLERIAAAVVALVPVLQQHVDNQRLPSPVRLPEKYWLSLREASELSGLGVGFLRELAAAGKLHCLPRGAHGGMRINRKSLEDFTGESLHRLPETEGGI